MPRISLALLATLITLTLAPAALAAPSERREDDTEWRLEHLRLNHWQGLKGGAIWLGGPAAIGTYGTEVGLGSLLGARGLYGTLDWSYFTTGEVTGELREFGLVKRHFLGILGLSYGLKGGSATFYGIRRAAFAFGGGPTLGAQLFLGRDFVASVDLAWLVYTPVRQSGGLQEGRWVHPAGPMLRTGLSVIF